MTFSDLRLLERGHPFSIGQALFQSLQGLGLTTLQVEFMSNQ